MDKKKLEAFKKLKKWDKIYNVTYDSFLELTLKDLKIIELVLPDSDKKDYIITAETEEWKKAFKDSWYKCNDWFPTKELAEERKEELIEYHKNNIENHTDKLVKLLINK